MTVKGSTDWEIVKIHRELELILLQSSLPLL